MRSIPHEQSVLAKKLGKDRALQKNRELAGTDVLAAQSDAPPGVILRTVWEWMLGA